MPPKKKPAGTLNLPVKKAGSVQKPSAASKGKAKVVAATPAPRGLGVAASATTTAATTAAAATTAPAPPPSPEELRQAAEDERALRAFDLDGLYGPCVNPTRLERWERAERLGLDPPKRVKEILLRYEGKFGPAPKKSGVSDRSLWFGRV